MGTRIAWSLLTLAALVAAPASSGAQTEPSAQEVQLALQQRNELVFDFLADFTQTYEGGMLRSRLVERGTLKVKRPGLMRWDYVDPEPKLYLIDGERFYSYLELDNEVIVGRMPTLDEATTAMQFLAGAGKITEDFTASFDTVENQPPDSYVLRLDPLRAERDFEFLVVVLDATTKAIRRLVAYDLQGGVSTFQFSNLEENTGLTDSPFRFDIPPNAYVTSLDEDERR